MTFEMWIATGAWISLFAGYLARRVRALHILLVGIGITVDVGLVGYLQLTRGAVQKALEFSLSPWAQIHIGCSTAALVLYLPVVYFGVRLARGDRAPGLRQVHGAVAKTCLLLRTLGFLFMFSMMR